MNAPTERVVWTPKLRRFVTPRTADDVKASKPPKLAKAWKALVKIYELHRRPYVNGVERADAERAQLMTEVDALATAAEPPAQPDARLLAGASVICGYAPDNYLPLAVALAAGGLELAVEVGLLASDLKAEDDRQGGVNRRWLVAGEGLPPGRDKLRARMLRADDETRAACLARAKEAWEAKPWIRPWLVHLFPEQAAWAEQLMQDYLEKPHPRWTTRLTTSVLAVAVRDLDQARRLLDQGSVYECPPIELVASLGVAALPLAIDALDAAEDGTLKNVIVRALAAVESPRAAAALARHLRIKSVRAEACDYFPRFPALARQVLPEVAAGKGAAARTAAKLLELVGREEAAAEPPSDMAPPDALPPVLASPPWERRRKRPKMKVVQGVARPREEYLGWLEGEQEPLPSWVRHVAAPLGYSDVPNGIFRLWDVCSPTLTLMVAGRLDARGMQVASRAWLLHHAADVIPTLVAEAAGPRGKQRALAESALRMLARHGHDPAIRAAADAVSAEVRPVMDALLEQDPLFVCPAKAPKLPRSWQPEQLPPVYLRDGRRLPPEAVERLGAMLKFSPVDPPYPGLEQVRQACDPRSLAELGWELAATWERRGARKGDDWMAWAIYHLGDDEVVRRCTPALKSDTVIDVLGALEGEAATMELATVAARHRGIGAWPAFRQVLAEQYLELAAHRQGLTLAQLYDRLVPTLGLEDGTATLDLGPRQLRVEFDTCLRPGLADGKGKRATQLRGRKDDDPEKLARARLLWADLREDVAALALHRTAALERAMLEQRLWELPEFGRCWMEHPLMSRLAAGLIWAAELPDGSTRTFRLTEDGTLAGDDDDELTLPDQALVFVPHPRRWPDDSLDRWRQVLDDYRIVQPIHQLGRLVAPPLTDDERGRDRLRRRYSGELSVTELQRSLRARRITRGTGWCSEPSVHMKADGHNVRLEPNLDGQGMVFSLHLERAPGPDPCPELEELLRELDAMPLE